MIGKTITHYKILEGIGRGGMGEVYLAEDLKLERQVAIKFLPEHLTTNEEEKQRFVHEAKAASSLDHNNICAIYEIDETEDNQLFISMAYYDGETLDKKIKEKPLPIEEASDIAIQIAQGLAKAHEKEIIHRDIKPANIMMTTDGVVKILDFGLAKLSKQTKLTKESTTLGTVSYMSPEQAKGEGVDYRTDIWSLGVILYETLTGQLPFKGEYESAVIYSILNDSQEPVTGLRTGVPMELERIINKCLQKSPADRYQHVDELIVDFKGLTSESTGIRPKEVKQKKRSKPVMLLLAILSILIFIVVGFFFNPFTDSEQSETDKTGWENSIAVLPFEDISPAKDQEYFCDGMTEQIISNLSRLPQLKVTGRKSVMKFKDSDILISEIGKELDVAYVLESSIRKSGSRIRLTAQLISTKDNFHVWSKDFDRDYSVEVFDLQDELSQAIATSLLAALSPKEKIEIKTNRPSNVEAWECYMMGWNFHNNKYFTARRNIDYFYKSEEMFLKSIELDSSFALSYAGLADLYHTYYGYDAQTEEEKKKYLELVEKNISKAYKLNNSSSYVNRVMGSLTREKGDLVSAFKFYKKAVELDENNSNSNYSLGWFFLYRGMYYQALKYLNRAVEIDPLYPQSYNIRGRIYEWLGKFEKAELNFKRALDIDPNHYRALLDYRILLIDMKRYDEAKKIIKKFMKLYPNSPGNEFNKSLIHVIDGKKEKALVQYPKELQMLYLYLVRLYLYLGMNEEAINKLDVIFEGDKNGDYSRYLLLNNHPLFDPFRSDPRFQEILAKHKDLYEENLKKYTDIE
jgi:serine/threonine protein kinase/Tfp pilus assembly protein PilF